MWRSIPTAEPARFLDRGRASRAAERTAFVDYRKAEIGMSMKARLAALESAARSDYAPMAIRLAPRASLRSTTAMRTSIDRRGRVIRVVGP